MLILKRKIVLSLIVILVISSSVFGSYWLIQNHQKSSADTAVNDKVDIVKGRVFAAGAWHNVDASVPVSGIEPDDVLSFYASPIKAVAGTAWEVIFPGLKDFCFYQFSHNYTPQDALKEPILIKDSLGIGYCIYNIKKLLKNSYRAHIEYFADVSITSGLPKIYRTNIIDVTSGDQINLNYKAEAKVLHILNYQNKHWTKNRGFLENFSGKIDAPYKLTMNGQENFKDKLVNWATSNHFGIDSVKSSWIVKTSGILQGRIKGSWHKNNWLSEIEYQTDELDFCPTNKSCSTTIEEQLNFIGSKATSSNDPGDGIHGPIESHAYHNETNTGSGIAIRDSKGKLTGGVAWNEISVDKIDNRSWKQDLYYPDKSESYFTGSQKSTAHIEPKTDSIQAETKYEKYLSIEQPTLHPDNPDLPNIKNTIKIMNRTDNNTNNNINRSGNGSSLIKLFNADKTVAGIPENISGTYDNVDEFLKITFPADRAGERIDLWQNVNPKYIQTYFPPGTIYVPGLFTATDGNAKKTVISTPPYKGIPQNIVYMISFTLTDGLRRRLYIGQITNFIEKLRKKGATVYTYDTSTKSKMIDALNKIPNDSLVINLGHGGVDGLTAGKDFISYKEIQQIIKLKQIKISTFVAGSCYAGRMPQSLASDVVSSMGVAWSSDEQTMLGSLIGTANNYWNATSNDLITKLKQISGCGN